MIDVITDIFVPPERHNLPLHHPFVTPDGWKRLDPREDTLGPFDDRKNAQQHVRDWLATIHGPGYMEDWRFIVRSSNVRRLNDNVIAGNAMPRNFVPMGNATPVKPQFLRHYTAISEISFEQRDENDCVPYALEQSNSIKYLPHSEFDAYVFANGDDSLWTKSTNVGTGAQKLTPRSSTALSMTIWTTSGISRGSLRIALKNQAAVERVRSTSIGAGATLCILQRMRGRYSP